MTGDQINEAIAKDPEAYTTRESYTKPHPDIFAALELVSKELHKAAVRKGFDAAHDDKHTDKSLAVAACFLIQDYYEPTREEERAIARHVALKRFDPPRDPWPAAYAHKKFNDSVCIQRLVIAAQFIISEIARLRRTGAAR